MKDLKPLVRTFYDSCLTVSPTADVSQVARIMSELLADDFQSINSAETKTKAQLIGQVQFFWKLIPDPRVGAAGPPAGRQQSRRSEPRVGLAPRGLHGSHARRLAILSDHDHRHSLARRRPAHPGAPPRRVDDGDQAAEGWLRDASWYGRCRHGRGRGARPLRLHRACIRKPDRRPHLREGRIGESGRKAVAVEAKVRDGREGLPGGHPLRYATRATTRRITTSAPRTTSTIFQTDSGATPITQLASCPWTSARYALPR